jgi:hypothetical protein
MSKAPDPKPTEGAMYSTLVPASIAPSNAKRRDTQYQQSSQEIPNTYEASYSANGYQKNTSYLAEKDAAMYGFNI